MNIRKPLVVLTCVACALSLAACLPKKLTSSSGAEQSETAAGSTEAPTTQSQANINPLTGLNDITSGTWVRPVAVMIGNNPPSRPQVNLDKADMYVEAETEGGITRIMAVFSGASRVPSKLGPIRSARTPFIKIAESLGSVYCHAGGSVTGLSLLKTADVGNIDALYGSNNSTFWRDAALKASKGLEYSLMTSGEKLSTRVSKLKLSTEAKKPSPFTYGTPKAGTGAGNKVQIRMSGYQTISFNYDSTSGLYYKSNGTLSNGEAHKSYDGVTITATNILIMYDTKYSENERTIGFNLQSGSGLLVSGGNSREIRWTRTTNSFKFTESDGSPLTLKAGKPYVCLTDTGNASSTIVA